MKKYQEFIDRESLGTVINNGLFANITTLRVGGKIRLLFYPNSYDNFIRFYRYYIKNSIIEEVPKLLIIGNGSNILASDDEFEGIVVCFKYIKKEIEQCCINDEYIIGVYAGTSLAALCNYLVENNFCGGEFLQNIPGVVGGAITMNASCYGSDIASIVKRVLCLDEQGNLKWLNKEELEFNYRNSIVRKDNYIIIKAEFIFKKVVDRNIIVKRIEELKRKRFLSQPTGSFNAGSVFKNKEDISAWKIVEELGFKGYGLGGCFVSDKHSNFIVNNGNAKASDIYSLIKKIKSEYKLKYNDELECEWVLVNFK